MPRSATRPSAARCVTFSSAAINPADTTGRARLGLRQAPKKEVLARVPRLQKGARWPSALGGWIISLKQAFDLALLVEEDLFRGRRLGQARHGYDLTADDDDEAGAGREPHLAHRHGVAGRRAAQVGVGREGVLGLGHADRQVAVAGLFPGMQLVADRLVGDRLVAAIDALDDGVDLLEQR